MEIAFDRPSIQQVGGRFHGEPQDPLSPQSAFGVQAICPRVTRIVATPANNGIWEVRAWGERLDRVVRVGAALADGTLANAQFELEGDHLLFPVACRDCEVYLGVRIGGRIAACIGPGYSLTWREGRPQG